MLVVVEVVLDEVLELVLVLLVGPSGRLVVVVLVLVDGTDVLVLVVTNTVVPSGGRDVEVVATGVLVLVVVANAVVPSGGSDVVVEEVEVEHPHFGGWYVVVVQPHFAEKDVVVVEDPPQSCEADCTTSCMTLLYVPPHEEVFGAGCELVAPAPDTASIANTSAPLTNNPTPASRAISSLPSRSAGISASRNCS